MKIMNALTLVSIPVACSMALADVELVAPGGTTTNISVGVQITTVLGSSGDTDSTNTTIEASNMVVDPSPESEPFSELGITEHSIYTSGGSLTFEFYCTLFGCLEEMDIVVHALDVRLVGDHTVGVDGSGSWQLTDTYYEMDLVLSYSGSLVGSGDLTTTETAPVTVSGDIYAENGFLYVENLDMNTISIAVPTDSLPDGLSELEIDVTADFSALVYSGQYNTADLDGDGQVCGADLTILLGNWGTCCTGDLDGDGTVSGADLTILLAAWDC